MRKTFQGTGSKSEQKGRSRIWIRQFRHFVRNTRRMLSPYRSRLISLFQSRAEGLATSLNDSIQDTVL